MGAAGRRVVHQKRNGRILQNVLAIFYWNCRSQRPPISIASSQACEPVGEGTRIVACRHHRWSASRPIVLLVQVCDLGSGVEDTQCSARRTSPRTATPGRPARGQPAEGPASGIRAVEARVRRRRPQDHRASWRAAAGRGSLGPRCSRGVCAAEGRGVSATCVRVARALRRCSLRCWLRGSADPFPDRIVGHGASSPSERTPYSRLDTPQSATYVNSGCCRSTQVATCADRDLGLRRLPTTNITQRRGRPQRP